MVRPMALDAIVVLGCRVRSGGALAGAARRRVERAAQAYASGHAELVFASGGRSWEGLTEADAFARALIELGVPDASIVRERHSQTTVQNARFVVRLARQRHLHRLGIVTCDWHLPRALAAFRRHAIDVTPLGARSPSRSPGARLSRHGLEWMRRLFDAVVSRMEQRA